MGRSLVIATSKIIVLTIGIIHILSGTLRFILITGI